MAYRSQHEHKCDAPRDVRLGFAELFRQLLDGHRHGEEVKRVPGPCNERDEELHPLKAIEQTKHLERVLGFLHGWFERSDTGLKVFSDVHLLLRGRRRAGDARRQRWNIATTRRLRDWGHYWSVGFGKKGRDPSASPQIRE